MRLVHSSEVDWSAGRYETTAARLLPAARLLVQRAAPRAGERVLDLGCGTGSAALLAARLGARVTGVDPAERLLEVARERALAERLDVKFVEGEAAELPVEDGSVDVLLSSFGVIFAPDATAAALEMARVTGPRGRIVLNAWLPVGVMANLIQVCQDAVSKALGAPAEPPGFPWHDVVRLTELFAPYGFSVTSTDESLPITAASAREYLEEQATDHPLSVMGRAVIERAGDPAAVAEKALAVLEAGNEEADSFRMTSRYRLLTVERLVSSDPGAGSVEQGPAGRLAAGSRRYCGRVVFALASQVAIGGR